MGAFNTKFNAKSTNMLLIAGLICVGNAPQINYLVFRDWEAEIPRHVLNFREFGEFFSKTTTFRGFYSNVIVFVSFSSTFHLLLVSRLVVENYSITTGWV